VHSAAVSRLVVVLDLLEGKNATPAVVSVRPLDRSADHQLTTRPLHFLFAFSLLLHPKVTSLVCAPLLAASEVASALVAASTPVLVPSSTRMGLL